ncbi:hypothetical protein [uncultured Sphingomonas sp.]|uniref:hypothetical protein n=1 Tax=uncultured Sphingomonas sp. TaxID=158754 RepID=UPI0035CAA3D5
MAEISNAEQRRRTKAMRLMSEADRRAAIDAAPNVIGFNRFADVARQRDLTEDYRRPRGGGAS